MYYYRPTTNTLLVLDHAAYFLVYHGSRDPRPGCAAAALAQRVAARLADVLGVDQNYDSSQVLVDVGALELAPMPLAEQLWQFGDRAHQLGYTQVKVVPLFLLPGVHVRDDLPAEVATAQRRLGDRITVVLCPHLGSHDNLANHLNQQFQQAALAVSSEAQDVVRVLVSHGSRRPGSNQPIEAIARQIHALPAYWSVDPSLEQRLEALSQTYGTPNGAKPVVILPYFLFAGGITDALAATVEAFQQRCPDVSIHLGHPLGSGGAIAHLVVELLQARAPAGVS